jgi:WD40 repeat protein
MALSNNTIVIWDWINQVVLKTFPGGTWTVSSWSYLKVLADGRLVAQSSGNWINIWNIPTGSANVTLQANSYALAIEELRNGQIVTAGTDSKIKLWNSQNGSLIKSKTLTQSQYFLKQTSMDSALASADSTGSISIWNLDTFTIIRKLLGHGNKVFMIDVMSNSNLVSASTDKTVRIWDFYTGICLNSMSAAINGMKMIMANVFALAMNSNSVRLVKIDPRTSQFSTVQTIPIPGPFACDVRVNNENVMFISIGYGLVGYYNLTNSSYMQTFTIGPPNQIGFLGSFGNSIDTMVFDELFNLKF